MKSSLHIVILAAGKGRRMKSSLPKVLHPVLFRPMLHYVLDLAKKIPHSSISVVLGHEENQVKNACMSYTDIQYFEQKDQLGTAHAVQQVLPFLKETKGNVLILSGDVILLTEETIQKLCQSMERGRSRMSLLTTNLSKPLGYGRIVRGQNGEFLSIREEVDCTEQEKKLSEINAGIYLCEIESLCSCLSKVKKENRQGEYYLPDIFTIGLNQSIPITTETIDDPLEVLGINDRHHLWRVESLLQRKTNQKWLDSGVMIHEIHTTYIDTKTVISSDVDIEGGCTIRDSSIKSGVKIEMGSRILNSTLGERVWIKQGSYIEESEIKNDCIIGPYAHLRPGNRLEEHVHVGNFVELKKSHLKEGVKASHLSYIGDADIGKNVNIGCGFITCNFDGKEKHKTLIEEDVFVGSDSQTVAPVTIQKGSYIASGTTVTENVPPYSLVLSRGKQVTKDGYLKLKKKEF